MQKPKIVTIIHLLLFSLLLSNNAHGQCSVSLGDDFQSCTGQEITLEALTSGGTEPYTYVWSNSASTISSISFTPAGDPTQNTTEIYTVTATDALGCAATDNISVALLSSPSATYTTTTGSCTVTSGVEFSFPNHPNRTGIEFSTDGGNSYYASVSDNSASVFYPLASGTYEAYARWGNSQCPTNLGTFNVFDDGTAISLDAGANESICQGETVTLSPIVTGSTGTLSYSWASTDGTESGTGLVITPLGSSTSNTTKYYDITVTDSNGCQAIDQITITTSSTPSVTLAITNANCNSIPGIEFSFLNHPNRSAIEFSVDGGASYFSQIADNSGSIFYGLDAGNYHAFSRWGNNQCPIDLGTFSIIDDGSALNLDVGADLTICDGETVNISPTVTNSTGVLTYTWSSTDGTESGTGLTITPVGSSTTNTTRYYDITVTDSNGCQAADQIRIRINSNPTATFITTDASCNEISGIEFSFPNHPNRTGIEFSLNGGASYLSSVADNSGSIFYNLAPGSHHAFIRWGDNSCPTDLGSFSILDDGSSIIMDAGNDLTICDGESITLNPTVTGGSGTLTYSWTSTDGIESGTGLVITPIASTTSNFDRYYDLTVTDSNGCEGFDQIKVRINSNPTANYTVTDVSCLSASGIEFTFDNHPNRSALEFSVNGGASYYTQVSDNSGSVFYNLPSGNYHAFTRWGNNQCPLDLGTFSILDNTISLDAGADIDICSGETATINPAVTNGTLPLNYTWETADGSESGTGLTITPLNTSNSHSSLSYNVTVTDADGCSATDIIQLNVLSSPEITSVTTEDGCGSTPAEVTIAFSDHTQETNLEFSFDGGITYLASVLDNSGSVSYTLSNGTYDAFARWSGGTCPISIGQFTLNTTSMSLEAGSDITICDGETVDITPVVTGGTAPYTYSWTDGTDSGTGTSFTPVGSSTSNTDISYFITVTDANECSDVDDLEVSVRSSPTAFTSSTVADCDGNAEITFNFPNHPQYGGLAFSFDGGVNYEAPVADASGSVSYPQPVGVYDTYVMWHNGLCPTQIGEAEVAGGSVFLSAASGNASDVIWTVPGSSNLFSIDFCEDRSLIITDGTEVTSDMFINVKDITIETNATFDVSTDNYNIDIFGDFTCLGTFLAHQSLVRFLGPANQKIDGNKIKFHDLEFQNFFNIDLETDMDMNGALKPSLGSFNINGNSLTLVSELVNGEVLTGSISEIGPFGDVNGEIEIQRYVKSLNDGFRFIGIPIQGQTVGDFQGDFVTTGYPGSDYPSHYYTNVTYYDESDRVSGDTESGFKNVTSASDAIIPNTGYVGYFPPSSSANLLNASGVFNKGDINYNLSYTNLGNASEDGWQIIPNPYPSAIDIMSSDITFTNVDRAIYIIDHELGSDWKGEYVVYNNGVSVNGATNIIASYQAFMVKANGPGASITFREACKSDEQGIFYRNQSEERPLLRFSLSQNEHKFESVIAFHEDATEAFDNNFDAYRKASVQFSIGTLCNADTLCINTKTDYNSELNIPVHVFTQAEGEYKFSLDEIQNISEPLCIRVEDLLTGEQHALNDGDFFMFSSEEGYDDVRFIINSSPSAEISVEKPLCADSEDGIIHVSPNVSDNYTYTLNSDSDPLNRTINSPNAIAFEGLFPGLYNLEISSQNGVCADSEIQILIGNTPILPEPSASYLRDECSLGTGKIFISANHDSELQTTIYKDGQQLTEVFGLELIEIDNLESGVYSVEVFDQCSSHEFNLDLTPLTPIEIDFHLPEEVTIINGSAQIELSSNSENALANSWLVNGEHVMEGENFMYEFTQPGDYEITLISRNGNCEKELSKTITVIDFTLGLADSNNSDFTVIMDEDFINVNASTDLSFDVIELFDLAGKLIEKWEAKNQIRVQINHRKYPAGIYVLRLSSNNQTLFMDKVAK